jgi:hypothetical protein
MWLSAEITVVVDEFEPPTILARITTPVGVVELLGNARIDGATLYLDAVHLSGLTPNAIGVTGLNAIGRKLLEEADVNQIIIQGGTRTSGRCAGRRPRVVRFPRSAEE